MSNQIKKFDIHHHIIPNEYIETLKELGIDNSAGLKISSKTIDDSLKIMDSNGIDVAICSISEPVTIPIKDASKAQKLAHRLNEIQKSYIDKYPYRFGAFAALPLPFIKESIDEIKYALDVLKLDGVGLLSNYGEHFLGDPIFDPIFEELNKRNAVVFVHPSTPPKDTPRPKFIMADFVEEFVFNTTRAATNLILSGTMERFPNIKIILAHAGGTLPYIKYRIEDTFNLAKILNSNGLIKDELISNRYNSIKKNISEYIGNFYYDLALSTHDVTYESLKLTTNNDHILFGSDANYAPPNFSSIAETSICKYSGFNNDIKDKIFYLNALNLFPRFKK
ncbi:amidohydrolase family protein [Clostridium thermobutyricum]|uniref:amidohydrolase family protein n=1 Tax=Clostridium thermobutyricum TaxID=29372 RepID=UPI003F527BF2